MQTEEQQVALFSDSGDVVLKLGALKFDIHLDKGMRSDL